MGTPKIIIYSLGVLAVLALIFGPLISPGSGKTIAAVTLDNDLYQEVDAYIEKQLKALNIPGASLAIVEGNQIVHTKEFGVIAPGGGAPTSQTPFFIGSLTKSFTALAVMQLAEAGKVDLDAPVQRYLPWFMLGDSEASTQITVRHLLTQTSGLSQIPGMIGLGNFDNTSGAGEQQARALVSDELAHPVGSVWEYSNTNYNLLGLIIEAVSGETYADYIQNHIFAPLDMRHSYTSKAAAQQDGLAVGHQLWFGFPIAVPNLPVPVGSLPSGQLISSTEDMAHYLIAQLNAGRYGDNQVVSPEGIAQMHQPAAEVFMMGKKMPPYGMGWYIDETSLNKLFMHWGETPDFFAYMALLPNQNCGIVLLVNADQHMYTYPLMAVGDGAASLLAGIQPASNAWLILPWVLRAFLLLPIIQIICISTTLRKVKCWQACAGKRPTPVNLWLFHILLPTALNLVLVVIGVGLLASGMLKFSMLFMGDLASVFLVSGAIALVWIIVRTPLIIKTLRIPQVASTSMTRYGTGKSSV